jgi:hypothetical protein
MFFQGMKGISDVACLFWKYYSDLFKEISLEIHYLTVQNVFSFLHQIC